MVLILPLTQVPRVIQGKVPLIAYFKGLDHAILNT